MSISLMGFSQSKPADSVYAMPKITVLKFNAEQMEVFNAVLSNQDFSRKKFSEFLEEVNRQINAQLVKVPVKKEETKK